MQEGEGPSQCVIEQSEPHERILFSLKFEDRSQEDSLQQERCARRDAWDRAQNCPKVQRKGDSHILLAFKSLVITSSIFDETRGKGISGGFQSINANGEQERSGVS